MRANWRVSLLPAGNAKGTRPKGSPVDSTILIAAINGSVYIVLGVFAVGLMGIGYGFFTREGSNIHHHGGGKSKSAPGLKGPGGGGSGMEDGEASSLDTHGTA